MSELKKWVCNLKMNTNHALCFTFTIYQAIALYIKIIKIQAGYSYLIFPSRKPSFTSFGNEVVQNVEF